MYSMTGWSTAKMRNVFDDRMVYGKDEDGNPTHWKEFKLIKKVS